MAAMVGAAAVRTEGKNIACASACLQARRTYYGIKHDASRYHSHCTLGADKSVAALHYLHHCIPAKPHCSNSFSYGASVDTWRAEADDRHVQCPTELHRPNDRHDSLPLVISVHASNRSLSCLCSSPEVRCGPGPCASRFAARRLK